MKKISNIKFFVFISVVSRKYLILFGENSVRYKLFLIRLCLIVTKNTNF